MNGNQVQELFLANLKSKTTVVSLLASNSQVKESQWQGTTFEYPAVRISVTFFPAVNRCLDLAEIDVQVFSAQKSSDQASTIAAAIQEAYHGRPFAQAGTQFPVVIVEKVSAPARSIYAWESSVKIRTRIA